MRIGRRLLQGVGTLLVAGAVGALPTPAGTAAPAFAVAADSAQASSLAAASASAATSATPAPRRDVAPGEAGVLIAPRDGGVLAPGADLLVDIDIVNRTDAPLDAGELVVYLDDGSIDTRYGLEHWIAADGAGPGSSLGVEVGRIAAPEVAAGQRARVAMTVPAASIPYGADAPFAPYGLAVRHMLGGAEASQGRSSVVWSGASVDAAATRLSAIVPITGPLSTQPTISAFELEQLTAPGGRLDELLDAVDGTSATLAIDPRLPASVRVLGERAPEDATAWLERLEALPNASFELPYADADLELVDAAGLVDGLAVPEVSALARPDDFAGAAETPAASATGSPGPSAPPTLTDVPTAAPTASAAPTDAAGEPVVLPTDAELLAVDASLDGIAWPAAGSLDADDLARVAALGDADVLVIDGANVELEQAGGPTPDADSVVDGHSAVVLDAILADAMRRASSASSDEEWNGAAAEMTTLLAVVSRELPDRARTLATAAIRSLPEDPAYLGRTLRLLDGLAWADVVPLERPAVAGQDGGDAGPRAEGAAVGSILPASDSPDAVAALDELFASERRGFTIASMYDEPARFRTALHASIHGALSAGWRDDPAAWATALGGYREYVAASEGSVVIVPTSDIQLVGQAADLPVFIQNNGGEPVTVQVALRPTTSLLEARDPVTIRIEPGSMTRAYLGVNAIANGVTSADVQLLTPDGAPISLSQRLNVNVRAEWEAVGIGIIIAVIALLFTAGIIRTIRRRRAESAKRHSPEADDAEDDDADGATAPPPTGR